MSKVRAADTTLRQFLRSPRMRRVLGSLLAKVDAHQLGADCRDEPHERGGPDQVGHRVGDRDVVDERGFPRREWTRRWIASPAVPITVDSEKAPANSPAAVPTS